MKHLSTKEIKQICLDNGIKWDDNATEITLCGKTISKEDFIELFSHSEDNICSFDDESKAKDIFGYGDTYNLIIPSREE